MGPPLEKEIEKRTKELMALREELEGELQSKAMPHLDRAGIALDKLEMRDMAELKSLAKPQEQLKKVMATIAAVVYDLEVKTEADWRKKVGSYLVSDLQQFDRDEKLKEGSSQLKELERHCADKELSLEEMESFAGPRVAKLLNTWIWAMHEYAQVMKPITPRIDKLHKMEKELEKLYEEKKELDKSKPSS
ncbi:DHC10 [Symbiodinium pilosum]|uniref:DHC10 protein n=1 Tax=Symbiodinium pilosum TaxID=2952 RepID=A0A812MTF4_SYMPI|nr:DHC10 [Symbiodinium pilosum]